MDLLPGESLSGHKTQITSPSSMLDEEINQKYVKGDVRIVTEQARYPLSSIASMVESKDYELNPEFQRRHRWSDEKKSRLIESLIMNVPIPPIFLYEDTFSHYEVMDGLQRMTAIYEFYRDKLKLEGLTEWPELNGRCYSSLPDKIKRGIDRRYLSSIILLQETAKNQNEALILKQMVFERINSGGEKLTPQESRNAIYNGPLNKLCIQLARNKYLCKTWEVPPPVHDENGDEIITDTLVSNPTYSTMADVELVLRFFAHRQRVSFQSYSLSDYLDFYLKNGNTFHQEVLSQLEELFKQTIEIAYLLLGQKAFWLYRKRSDNWNWYKRPTTAVYDPMMYALSINISNKQELVEKKEVIREKIKEFYKMNYHAFEGRNTNQSILIQRNELFTNFFQETINR